MVQENEGNGKKEISFSVGSKTAERAEKLADRRNETVEEFAKQALHERIGHHEVKKVLAEACDSGRLSESNFVCRKIAQKEEEFHHSY